MLTEIEDKEIFNQSLRCRSSDISNNESNDGHVQKATEKLGY